MHGRLRSTIGIGLAALLLTTTGGLAQEGVGPTPPAQSTPSQQASFTAQQLDQLLAPVALYPDQLLGQILMASTYPLEVVEAARWLQDSGHAALKGDQLAQALAPIDWDPSVKALVPFPRILQMMSQQLDWTQNLGNAFLAEQNQVMDSVQRLRRQAETAGNLRTTQQQVVRNDSGEIVIQPANPDVLYVPYYDPTLVYGAWPYAAYPPYYFPPPPGYVAGPGLYFGLEFPIVSTFWGWNSFDWRDHRIHVDRDRFNRIDRVAIERNQVPALQGDTWRHDPFHRRGVAYGSPDLRQRFGATERGAAEQRRAFRDYSTGRTYGAPGTPERRGAAAPGPRTAAPYYGSRPQSAARAGEPGWRGSAPQAGTNPTRPQTAARPAQRRSYGGYGGAPAVRPQTAARPPVQQRARPNFQGNVARPSVAARPHRAATPRAPAYHAPAATARAPAPRPAAPARAPAARPAAPAYGAPPQTAHEPDKK